MYRFGLVHERGYTGLLQRELIILKHKMRLQMYMVRRGLLPEDKQLSNQHYINLWERPRKDNKLWLIEVTSSINASNRSGKEKQTG